MALRPRSQAAKPAGTGPEQLADALSASLKGGGAYTAPEQNREASRAAQTPEEKRETGALLGALAERAPGPAPTKTEPAPPPLFATPHAGPGIQPDFRRVVETLFEADAFADYSDLEKNLEVGEGRGDYATLREHLDRAEARARRAHKLWMGSRLELVRWELDARRVAAEMRRQAKADLEGDEARSKRITDADVEARIAEKFPDEVEAQEVMRAKLKGTVESLEHLTSRWNAKTSDLRTLLETLRR